MLFYTHKNEFFGILKCAENTAYDERNKGHLNHFMNDNNGQQNICNNNITFLTNTKTHFLYR